MRCWKNELIYELLKLLWALPHRCFALGGNCIGMNHAAHSMPLMRIWNEDTLYLVCTDSLHATIRAVTGGFPWLKFKCCQPERKLLPIMIPIMCWSGAWKIQVLSNFFPPKGCQPIDLTTTRQHQRVWASLLQHNDSLHLCSLSAALSVFESKIQESFFLHARDVFVSGMLWIYWLLSSLS